MKREGILQVLLAACATTAAALVYVLVFTLIIQLFSLDGALIKPVNQVFKVICIAVGCLIFIRGTHGLIKGAVAGALGIVATFLLFSLIGGVFNFSLLALAELAVGVVCGGISGIIAVNIKKM